MPAAVYIETHGGTGIGGSDDHAGVDIGRTFTETPPASTPEEFLAHVREGTPRPRGEQGSAAKWAHAALALAARARRRRGERRSRGRRRRDWSSAGRAGRRRRRRPRRRRSGGGLGPSTPARCCAPGSSGSTSRRGDPATLIELMQADDFSHADLYRRARRVHERRLRDGGATAAAARDAAASGSRRRLRALFEACVAGDPLRAGDDLPRRARRRSSAARDGEPRRVGDRRRRRRGRCTASPTRSSGSASAACPGSRSR